MKELEKEREAADPIGSATMTMSCVPPDRGAKSWPRWMLQAETQPMNPNPDSSYPSWQVRGN
jgi:hypothetical protein